MHIANVEEDKTGASYYQLKSLTKYQKIDSITEVKLILAFTFINHIILNREFVFSFQKSDSKFK